MPAKGLWAIRVHLPARRPPDQVAAVESVIEPMGVALSSFAAEGGDGWTIEVLCERRPRSAAVQGALKEIGAPPAVLAYLPPKDWVAENQRLLAPLRIGRFFIHGAHFKGRPPRGAVPLQIDASLARGERLIASFEEARARLAETGGRTWEGESLQDVEAWLDRFRRDMQKLAATTLPRQFWGFLNPTDQLLHDHLVATRAELDELIGQNASSLLQRARLGLQFASECERISHGASGEWDRAIEAIGDPLRSPAYRGLALPLQNGLLPLGPDPKSGLWEFAHLQTGEPARRGPGGALEVSAGTGIVLVLVPRGETYRGAQRGASGAPNFDPFAELDEQPVHPLTIDAFFLSKFELTQAQWERWAGWNDGERFPEEDDEIARQHPVENVSWQQATAILRELGLELPSEAQWEYAARAGTTTPWSTGETPASLSGHANLAREDGLEIDYRRAARHVRVGSLRPNPWGLHDMHGNVMEWCRDEGDITYSHAYYQGTGERQSFDYGQHVARGGSYETGPLAARSAARRVFGERFRQRDVGLRPARPVTR